MGVLTQARASFARRSWGEAYAQFAAADAATPLDLDDLEKLASASYLTGHDEESASAWTRAHHEAIRRDDPPRAARNAVLVGSGLMFRGETAPAMGWFARGTRVVQQGDPGGAIALHYQAHALAEARHRQQVGVAETLGGGDALGERGLRAESPTAR